MSDWTATTTHFEQGKARLVTEEMRASNGSRRRRVILYLPDVKYVWHHPSSTMRKDVEDPIGWANEILKNRVQNAEHQLEEAKRKAVELPKQIAEESELRVLLLMKKGKQ